MSCCACVSPDTLPAPPGPGPGPDEWESFEYVATGAEGQQFTVTLPTVRDDALYQIRYMLGTAVHQFQVALVDGSETTTDFDVTVTTTPMAGDVIHFDVFNAP